MFQKYFLVLIGVIKAFFYSKQSYFHARKVENWSSIFGNFILASYKNKREVRTIREKMIRELKNL